MGWLDSISSKEADWEKASNATAGNKGDLTHDIIAAAASYEAVKAYENHVAANGVPDSHSKAKEILAAAAAGFITHMVETKGMDFIDKKKAEKAAQAHVDEVITEENFTVIS